MTEGVFDIRTKQHYDPEISDAELSAFITALSEYDN